MGLSRRTYEIRLVTPAFLAGADQQAPELRAPSIRGCLRWWFRLAERGAGTDLPDIRKKESELFGSMDTGQRLILRVRPDGPLKIERPSYRDLPFDHQYLWFPLRPERESSQPITRPALAAGTSFKLEAIIPPSIQNGEQVLRQLDDLVAQWVLFGSIGMRGRRCAGSVWFLSQLPSGSSMPAGKTGIEKTLDNARKSLPIEFVVGSESFTKWQDAVKAAGNHYRGQRTKVKENKGRKALPGLGWPIMKYPGAKGDKIIVDGHDSERLASPVLLKVIPDGSKFRWLLVVIKKPFADLIESAEGQVRQADVVSNFAQGFEAASAPPPSFGRGPKR
jgi:CRISPR-associated protein Cmr1